MNSIDNTHTDFSMVDPSFSQRKSTCGTQLRQNSIDASVASARPMAPNQQFSEHMKTSAWEQDRFSG